MAIYHLSVKEFSVARGQSAVAAVAYRRAANLINESTGQYHSYSNKPAVIHSEIAIPDGSPRWVRELSELPGDQPSQKFWSQVEHHNTRINSRLANEIVLALPIELTSDQNIDLVRQFVSDKLTSRGLVADWSYHAVPDNPHVHIMVQTRPLAENGFGPVMKPVLDNEGIISRDKNGKLQYSLFGISKLDLPGIREAWANVQNHHLAMHGHDVRVDHRSYEEQGIALVPTTHIGVGANALAANGGQSDRIERNNEIQSINRQAVLDNPEIILDKITAQKSVFNDRDIAREVFKYTDNRADYQSVILRIGASDNLIALAAPVYDPVSDKEITSATYTTRAVFENEYSILENAEKLHGQDTFYVPEKRVQASINSFEKDKGFSLSDEQKAVIRYVTQAQGIATVVGYAGAGKSTVMNVVRQAYEANGARVFGAALAGVAVDGLRESSGINSRTIRSWEVNWERDKRNLQAGDVFVLDEAGMVSSQQMRTIVEHVEKAGAKLIIVGDHRQLQPIMSGAAFRGIAENVGYRELTGIIRQRNPEHVAASLHLARGETRQALERHEALGNIQISAKGVDARKQIVQEWGQSWHAGNDAIILTHRNDDVEALNQYARSLLKDAGGLQDEFSLTTSKGTKSFAIGDKIIFLEGDYETGLKNGSVGFITEYDQKTRSLSVEVDNGKTVSIDTARYNSFTHGYAQTIHKSQGKTVDDAFIYATSMMDAQLSYVALTRHRDYVRLITSPDAFKDRDDFLNRLSNDRQKDVSFLHRHTQDYADALRGFMERRDLGTPSDWKAAVERTVNHWKGRLEQVTERLRSVRQRLFPSQEIRSTPEQRAQSVRSPVNPSPVTSPVPAQTLRVYTVMPDNVRQVVARLQHTFEHAERMDTDRSRKEVLNTSQNAFVDGSNSREVRTFMAGLKDVMGPTTILAAGQKFNAEKLAPALSQFSAADQQMIESDWPALHSLARASFAVNQLEVAKLMHSESKDNRIEAAYEKSVSLWRTPEKELVPAMPVFNEDIAKTVSRIAVTHPETVKAANYMQKDIAQCYTDAGAIAKLFINDVRNGVNVHDTLAMMQKNPEQIGDMHGKRNFLGRPNEERAAAIAAIPAAVSAMRHFASRYENVTQDVTQKETLFRQQMQTGLPGLSQGATNFIEKFNDVGANKEQLLNSDEGKQARREIGEFMSAFTERFGRFETSPTESERFNRVAATIDPAIASELATQVQHVKSAEQSIDLHSSAYSLGQSQSLSQSRGNEIEV